MEDFESDDEDEQLLEKEEEPPAKVEEEEVKVEEKDEKVENSEGIESTEEVSMETDKEEVEEAESVDTEEEIKPVDEDGKSPAIEDSTNSLSEDVSDEVVIESPENCDEDKVENGNVEVTVKEEPEESKESVEDDRTESSVRSEAMSPDTLTIMASGDDKFGAEVQGVKEVEVKKEDAALSDLSLSDDELAKDGKDWVVVDEATEEDGKAEVKEGECGKCDRPHPLGQRCSYILKGSRGSVRGRSRPREVVRRPRPSPPLPKVRTLPPELYQHPRGERGFRYELVSVASLPVCTESHILVTGPGHP